MCNINGLRSDPLRGFGAKSLKTHKKIAPFGAKLATGLKVIIQVLHCISCTRFYTLKRLDVCQYSEPYIPGVIYHP